MIENATDAPVDAVRETISILEELGRRERSDRLSHYQPYDKQKGFHEAGVGNRERLFMAGNQLGKTLAGAAEAAMHLTGRYPDWWQGKRFNGPIVMLAGSESYELTRDGVQRLLIGPPAHKEDWGTAMIPKQTLIGTTSRSGVSNAIDSATIGHESGGASTILFKAYEQGRGKWQANTVDYVWFDEEPPEDVYFEGITRTNATGGAVVLTFTPLNGMSAVVNRFLVECPKGTKVTTMTIDDALHYTEAERASIIASYPPHEREARVKGVPTLGSGRIFPVDEGDITCAPFEIPRHFPQIGSMDFGWDHPFAAVRLAFGRDNDVVYVTHEYRRREATPIVHAAALKPWGSWLPFAWPHDGLQHDKGSGSQLKELYARAGLSMLPHHAKFEDGSTGVEAGLADMLERMETGRFKVFRTCSNWFEEFRLYHRKDGKVVKERDDLLAATRYGLMMKRFAITRPAKARPFKKRKVI